jgi:hypothetical protein
MLATNTTLNFNGGTHTLDLATHLDGEGIVAFTGGNVTLDGPFRNRTGREYYLGNRDLQPTCSGAAKRQFERRYCNFNQTSLTLSNWFLSSGTLGGTASLLVTNSMSWSGGTLLGTNNDLTVAKGATLAINGGNDKNLTRTFNNLGTVLWNEGRIFANGALINNLAEAFSRFIVTGNFTMRSLIIRARSARLPAPGPPIFATSTGSTGRFNNNGLLDLQSGTMSVYCGGTSSGGSFSLATNTLLLLASGTPDLYQWFCFFPEQDAPPPNALGSRPGRGLRPA